MSVTRPANHIPQHCARFPLSVVPWKTITRTKIGRAASSGCSFVDIKGIVPLCLVPSWRGKCCLVLFSLTFKRLFPIIICPFKKKKMVVTLRDKPSSLSVQCFLYNCSSLAGRQSNRDPLQAINIFIYCQT